MYMEKTNEELFNLNDFIDEPNEEKVETDSIADDTKTSEPESTEIKKEAEVKKDTEEKETPLPVKDPDENETAFNIRTQLSVAKAGRDEATTPEEKSFFESKMSELRKGLTENSEVKKEETQDVLDQDDIEAAKKTLAQMGIKTEKEILAIIDNKLASARGASNAEEQVNAMRTFYTSRKDIASNSEAREFLDNYVFDNFNINPNTKPDKVLEYYKIAGNMHFPAKSTSRGSSSNASEKASLTDVTSNTSANTKGTTIDAGNANFLKSQGWSDSDIESW